VKGEQWIDGQALEPIGFGEGLRTIDRKPITRQGAVEADITRADG